MPRTRSLAALALALVAGCHETVGPLDAPPPLALAGVERFDSVAESLYAAGADPARWNGYYGLGRIVLNAGEATPLFIEVDGVTEEYVAVAEQIGGGADCLPQPGMTCPDILEAARLRVLVAWNRADPGRVVQLTATAPQSPITRPALGADPFATGATLIFLDGKGGFFTATSGDAALTVTSVGGTPCYVQHNYPLMVDPAVASIYNPVTCTMARLAAGFTAEASRPAIGGPRENSAAGAHHLALRLRSLPGGAMTMTSNFCFDCAFGRYPYGVRPPLDPRSQVLTATLTAQVTDVVTLTFTVKNPTAAAVTIDRSDTQRYDFAILDGATNQVVWRWGAGKGFAQMLGSETLAPGASVVYVEQWTPTVKGYFLAQARLASTDQLATAGASVVVP